MKLLRYETWSPAKTARVALGQRMIGGAEVYLKDGTKTSITKSSYAALLSAMRRDGLIP